MPEKIITILEAIQLSTTYLEKKGIDSARINAELLLASILNCKRLELYLAFDRPLKEIELSTYRDFISRRGKYEPLQYITGNVEFYGLNFIVNPSVLIPRQETEILVEEIINRSGREKEITILDIGCGSGNISIALAKNLPNANVTALDISDDAIKVARGNAVINQVADRVSFVTKDIKNQNGISEIGMFDVIVSNPPYVELNEYNNLQKEIVVYEPQCAVTDYENGFSFYEQISLFGKSNLKQNGSVFFEVGQGQSDTVQNILKKDNYKNVTCVKDYLNIERVVCGEKK